MPNREGASSGGILSIIGPGILVAATGVGAGDLATGAIVGSRLGTMVLWAVLIGAFLKYVLSEGLARWQLVTGETVLEGALLRFGRAAQLVFLLYLLVWSFAVGSALLSACGVTAHAIYPVFGDSVEAARHDKILYGIIHSVVAVLLVELGGFKLFERVMACCIAAMFVTVMACVVMMQPDWGDVLAGALIPRIPFDNPDGFARTVALMGGVGGTLTIICYGYWIREKSWNGIERLQGCRLDLAVGYAMTALFGMAMVVLGSEIAELDGGGANLLVKLADLQAERLGEAGRWAFLIGGWGAVVSSLFGVWQCVPYVFADFCRLVTRSPASLAPESADPQTPTAIDTRSIPYRAFLYGIAVVPAIGLWSSFEYVQIAYAILGAMFIPLLAVVLLLLNGRERWIGSLHKNGWGSVIVLAVTVGFFAVFAWFSLSNKL
ncbi:MAG: Nramp family divalent metal transporter [Planctomycetota bacterium]|nr:Nramp family divalent metal transporter [Planctomycetota bacterium]